METQSLRQHIPVSSAPSSPERLHSTWQLKIVILVMQSSISTRHMGIRSCKKPRTRWSRSAEIWWVVNMACLKGKTNLFDCSQSLWKIHDIIFLDEATVGLDPYLPREKLLNQIDRITSFHMLHWFTSPTTLRLLKMDHILLSVEGSWHRTKTILSHRSSGWLLQNPVQIIPIDHRFTLTLFLWETKES